MVTAVPAAMAWTVLLESAPASRLSAASELNAIAGSDPLNLSDPASRV